jgi:pimeloyl-ACP methyl ester carboxylesterase
MIPAGSGFTRVCAYDRPGTVAPLKDDVRPSRSDPIPQPRTAPDAVVDLHTLLRAAGVPGPYVLAGHSLGGLFMRLYASTYPGDVVGLILVDPYSERLETLLTAERWAALVWFNVRSGSDTVELHAEPDARQIEAANAHSRRGVSRCLGAIREGL